MRLDWTKDEHILALDVYFQHPDARNSKTHQAVIELSKLLNKLPIYAPELRDEEFRNANGVGMKLSNFKRCDPDYKGAGLKQGAKLEEEVWDEYAHDLDKLRKAAQSIIDNAALLTHETLIAETIPDDEEAFEGRILTVTHKIRERDSGITQKKKQKVLQETSALVCEACGFDFKKKYGALGEGFAECHHEKPVSQLKAGEKTKISDLRILCANCHRMIHRSKPWLSVDELKRLIRN